MKRHDQILLLLVVLIFQGCIESKTSSNRVSMLLELQESSTLSLQDTENVANVLAQRLGNHAGEKTIVVDKGVIALEFTRVEEPQTFVELLVSPGHLEFWFCHNNLVMIDKIVELNTSLRNQNPQTDSLLEKLREFDPDDPFAKFDSGVHENLPDEFELENPLYSVMALSVSTYEDGSTVTEGPILGYAFEKNVQKTSEYLQVGLDESLFPRYTNFAWSKFPVGEQENVFMLYGLKGNAGRAPVFSGDGIVSLTAGFGEYPDSEIYIEIENTLTGRWERLQQHNVGEGIAMVLDGKVLSAPTLSTLIKGNQFSYYHNFSYSSANILVATCLNPEPKLSQFKIADIHYELMPSDFFTESVQFVRNLFQ